MDSGTIYEQTTICARATAPGQGAIAVVRISGPEAVTVLERVYRPMKEEGGVRAAEFRAREMHYGRIVFPEGNAAETVIDEVMAVVFRAPHSYTGEDSAEIYCHGSQYIVSEILRALIAAGAEMASAGEFTKRAFLNGRMDLAQAEAVADLIASENKAAHDIALQQLRGGYSSELQEMRSEMLDIVSLMELELDFSEEDVEFADRTRVLDLIDRVSAHISRLADSFALGNAIKNGIPVAIVGAVNTGKSTLLNALLGEDRAIVSDIAGTTRDTIEDTVNIAGVTFRFIDTAGIRETSDSIETIGINRTYTTLSKAALILLMLDATRPGTFGDSLAAVASRIAPGQRLFVLLNKADLLCGDGIAPSHSPSDLELYDPAVEHPDRTDQPVTAPVQDYASLAALPAVRSMLTLIEDIARQAGLTPGRIIPLSARCRLGLPEVTSALTATAADFSAPASATLVTNLRHYQALRNALTALSRSREALTAGVSTEFVTQDIREALYHIGTICGQVTSDEILGSIFSRFCIGK